MTENGTAYDARAQATTDALQFKFLWLCNIVKFEKILNISCLTNYTNGDIDTMAIRNRKQIISTFSAVGKSPLMHPSLQTMSAKYILIGL